MVSQKGLMMSHYQETKLIGRTWVRSHEVVISNPLDGLPGITFRKELVRETSDGARTSTTLEDVRSAFGSPETDFDLINPETGQVIGRATHQQVYIMLHSLFISLDSAR